MRCSLCLSRLALAMFGLEHSPPSNTMPISGTSRRAGRYEWPADERHLDCLPEVAALFTAGAQVTTNATEYLRSSQRAEAPGDFLAHLDHADALLALVIGKGHPFIPQERQNGPVKILQPIQQVGRLALRTAAPTRRPTRMPVASPPDHRTIIL